MVGLIWNWRGVADGSGCPVGVCVCVCVLDGMVAEEDTGIVSLGATS